MRKLATASLAFSAAIFLAYYVLPRAWLIPLCALALLAAIGIALLRRRWLRPVVLALVFLATGLLEYQIYCRLTVDRAAALAGQTRPVSGVLLDYPEDFGSYCRLRLRLDTPDLPRLKAIAYDNHQSFAGLQPGQRVSFTAKLSPADTLYGEPYPNYQIDGYFLKLSIKGDEQAGETRFSPRSLPLRLHRFRCARVDSLFPDACRAFLKALMLGDKGDFYEDDALYVSMSRSGLMHVAAVSGLHIVFLTYFLVILLGNGRRGALTSIVLIWCFVLLTGSGKSAVRAAFMQTLLLLAPIVRRENDPVTSLSAVLALLLAACPLAAGSVSLQMSFAAMAGILCFFRKIYERLLGCLPKRWRHPPFSYIPGVIASSLSVMVFTTPLSALHFSSVPLLGVLSNLACLWAVSLCFCLAWIACLLSIIPPLGAAAAWLCAWVARFILFVAARVSAWPGAVLYMETEAAALWVAVSYALLLVGVLLRHRRVLRVLLPAGLSLALLLAINLSTAAFYRSHDCFSVLDVGQGQCIAAFAGDATAVIDCGNISSRKDAGTVAGEYLLSRGRRCVDVLVLTHLHADHADGVTRLMELLPVRTLILPENAEDENDLREKILACAARHGTTVRLLSRDSDMCCGRIGLRLFQGAVNGRENERCLMARLSIGELDMLVTADAPAKLERALTERAALEGTELLIVGHHGAKDASSPALLEELGGSLAVVSVGFNNYGHPRQEVLERLAEHGYRVLRTDQDGTIEVMME